MYAIFIGNFPNKCLARNKMQDTKLLDNNAGSYLEVAEMMSWSRKQLTADNQMLEAAK